MKKMSQTGAIDFLFIAAVVIIVAVGGFTYWRVSQSNNEQAHTDTTEQLETASELPTDLGGLKTLDDITQITGVASQNDIIKFELESKDGGFIYKVVLSDGRKLVIDAQSGEVISEETTDVSDDDKIPAGITVDVTPAEAYQIATAQYNKSVKKIEMEVEDKKVVYKVEFTDGSKVEIDATTGAVVKSETKDEDESSEDKDEHDDEEDGHDENEEDEHEEEDENDDDEERKAEDDDSDDENED